MAAGLAAASLAGCSTSEIYPVADADLDLVATWGSAQAEKTRNGASVYTDAALLPTSATRIACHEKGCFVAVSSNEIMDGPGLEGAVSDAVLAWDGDELTAVVTSKDAELSFVLDGLAATPDGERFALAGRFTGKPMKPFGSTLTFPAPDGALVATGDATGGIDAALWLVRADDPDPTDMTEVLIARGGVGPAQRAVVGGLLMPDAERVLGGVRFRDELYLVDDVLPSEPFPKLRKVINGNDELRWGTTFAARLMSGATPSQCEILEADVLDGSNKPHSPDGIMFETLAIAGANGLVLSTGHYRAPFGNAVTLGLNGANVVLADRVEMPETGAPFMPFVARSGTSGGIDIDLQSARSLGVPGALEAAAMQKDGSWLACGRVDEGNVREPLPESCRGLSPGSWLVAHGRFDIEGCVDLKIEGRCRAAIISPAGFVIAGSSSSDAGESSTLVEIDVGLGTVRRLDRVGVAIDTLGLFDGEVVIGGSFTGTFDQRDPRGGTSDWDLFVARWVSP